VPCQQQKRIKPLIPSLNTCVWPIQTTSKRPESSQYTRVPLPDSTSPIALAHRTPIARAHRSRSCILTAASTAHDPHAHALSSNSRPSWSPRSWADSKKSARTVLRRAHTPHRQMRARRHGRERVLRRTLRELHLAPSAVRVLDELVELLRLVPPPEIETRDHLGVRTAF